MTTSSNLIEATTVTRTVVSPIESLTDALVTERRLLDELIGVMRRQRAAVGKDDLQTVDDSVFSTHRVLVTLGEARRRRRNLNTLIGQQEDLAIHSLDDALDGRAAHRARRIVEIGPNAVTRGCTQSSNSS